MTAGEADDKRRELTRRERELLCELADPQGEPLPMDALDGADALALLRAAREHAVEPVVLRKFRQAGLTEAPELRDYCRAAIRDRMYISAIALVLGAQADRIAAALTAGGLPHAIVKGGAFARDIYPDPAERPFSDIDILLPRAALAPAADIMKSLEFEQYTRDFMDQSEVKQEQQWGYRGDPQLLAELHTDMVHAPTLRRRVSFGYEKYDLASAGGERPFAGHFAVAVAHASVGHKFHPLRLMVDILQAVRHLSDEDIAHLAEVMDDLRLHPTFSK